MPAFIILWPQLQVLVSLAVIPKIEGGNSWVVFLGEGLE